MWSSVRNPARSSSWIRSTRCASVSSDRIAVVSASSNSSSSDAGCRGGCGSSAIPSSVEPPMGQPAYTRLDVDERRRRLLELGAELFARHGYEELSMARIAREAGISKALLYHYFPSKQAYFAATLEAAAIELAEVTRPDPSKPPVEQLAAALDAYLGWVERHMGAYDKLIRSVGAVPEVREMVERVRDETAGRILAGLAPGGEPEP